MDFKALGDCIPGRSRMISAGLRQISGAVSHVFRSLCVSGHAQARAMSLKDMHCAEISHYGVT